MQLRREQTMEERERSRIARELTSYMLHKHYCENDVEAILSLFDDRMSWFGAADHEYAVGAERVAEIFRTFAGQVPPCNLTGERYDVLPLSPELYLCTGQLWVATDPATQIFLRVHQRVAMIFRWVDGRPRCCHIHISNPYSEMGPEDVGFPTGMAKQSAMYLREQLAAQQRQLQEQTAELARLSYEDTLTGLFNRNRFNQELDRGADGPWLGVACFDLNELKAVNDRQGHSAGDALLRRTGECIRAAFPGAGYRVGGDEFVIIDREREERDFLARVELLRHSLRQEGVNAAGGWCWRSGVCNIMEQLEASDRRMYQEKEDYYRRLEAETK